ncbi:hypothetical protein [Pseudomonas juntendi]|uniref:hypothetical protein n=1 Tax=Pseudomonas juntendi TaxID=2666183 RepID=UPI00137B1C68|nr:hypothetical protein [Pseudomonas juntendi]
MRSREQDRQRWNDPDFNKWLDEAISDAGHTVWDSIPDVGSAWNGWDASKAALGYYCPACSGSGEEIHVTYHGPDSFERLGHCTVCNGDGRTSAALAVASERLVSETAHRGDLQAKVWGLQAEIDKLKSEIEALRSHIQNGVGLIPLGTAKRAAWVMASLSVGSTDEERGQ